MDRLVFLSRSLHFTYSWNGSGSRERERGEGLIRERKGTFAEIIPIPRILFANCEVQGAEERRVSFSLFIPPRPLSFLEKFGGKLQLSLSATKKVGAWQIGKTAAFNICKTYVVVDEIGVHVIHTYTEKGRIEIS